MEVWKRSGGRGIGRNCRVTRALRAPEVAGIISNVLSYVNAERRGFRHLVGHFGRKCPRLTVKVARNVD